jgi:hypothetical protein
MSKTLNATKPEVKAPLITDEQSLDGATNEYGRAIPVYDDGYGPLFIHRDSSGISGIVRAQTWEDAYGICEDEFFPAGDDYDPEDFKTEYKSGRELWLHEHGNNWEAWQALSEAEKNAAYRADGKDVPFVGEVCDHPCFQEQYGFRGNSRKESDGTLSSIYAKDLNGDSLDVLTPELLAQLGITLAISTPE